MAQVLGALAAAHVDNGAALQGLQDVDQFSVFVGGLAHHVGQVLALKAHAEHVLLAEGQLTLYVGRHLGGGGGGERQHGGIGLDVAYLLDLKVGGTEVVAPLADAVGFVDGDEAHLHVAQLGLEYLRGEALW